MAPLSTLELLFAAWIVTATLVVIFMVRRGHNPPLWTVLAFGLGPASLFVAVWSRYRSRFVSPTTLTEGNTRGGPLSVLVGVDGSPEAHDALLGALDLLGDRIGRLYLAAVVDYESASRKSDHAELTAATAALESATTAATRAGAVAPTTSVLAGPPAQALLKHAVELNVDLIVIGPRGRGEATWLKGSVANGLVNETRVRVAIIGGVNPRRSDLSLQSDAAPASLI